MSTPRNAEEIQQSWENDPRWTGIERPYTAADVIRLRGTIQVEHTLARIGSERLWNLLETEAPVCALGAYTGNQAVQQVAAGLRSIYLSGWQVAADANTARHMYPDQSLYPVDSVPSVVDRVNQAFMRADHIACAEGREKETYWFAPIVADAEAGFGGILNAYELMKAMIESGASGVHFEDQLSSAKKCGHLGGKVVVPTKEFVSKLVAARLAADVLDIPTILVARTDTDAARHITSDVDPYDAQFITEERTSEGFCGFSGGLEAAIARGVAYAPYADMIWCETSTPDLDEARRFAEGVHAHFPGKKLAYNCSPSFDWSGKLSQDVIASYREELASMGYVYQFITLAGFHSLNLGMYDLASGYAQSGMSAYSQLQDQEFERERTGRYEAVKHQRFVGTGYFDQINVVVSAGDTSTLALEGSTEAQQF